MKHFVEWGSSTYLVSHHWPFEWGSSVIKWVGQTQVRRLTFLYDLVECMALHTVV